MEKLWAPWRMTYILSDKPDGCVFCHIKEEHDQQKLADRLVLKKLENCFVILNLYPYNNCHVMVIPYTHCAQLEKLPFSLAAELIVVVGKSVEILKKVVSPEGFNVGMNLGKVAGAGVDEHLHWHIVPRWGGDANFMPVLADTKVMPQHLRETYGMLKPYFDQLDLADIRG